MNTHKVYRSSLSFRKDDLQKRVSLGIEYAGISMPKVALDQFSRSESFGWFGSDSDSNKFYPGVDVQNDVVPKPEDFIDAPFRLISAGIVGAGSWKATDFSQVGVLKASTPMLKGKPVYKDHNTDINNWVGFVKNVTWQESYTDNGIVVPAGINGILAIDGKTEPKMARGVSLGVVFSNSVTVEFDWTPSHTFADMYEFDNKIGTYDEKGEMIRRIVTAIYAYHETSMVWLGADPFAKLIDKDGKLKDIDVTSIQYDKVTEEVRKTYEDQKKYDAKFGMEAKSYISLSKTNETFNNNNKKENMNKFLAAFIAVFGASIGLNKDAKEGDLKDEMIEKINGLKLADAEADKKVGWFTKFYEAALTFMKLTKPETATVEVEAFLKDNTFVSTTELARLQALDAQVTSLTADKTRLEGEVATLKPDAALGQAFTKQKKDEAVRLYKAFMKGKPDEAVITLINGAKPAEVEGLLKQYCKGATEKFGGRCKECGSAEFEFRSSLVDEGTLETPTEKPIKLADWQAMNRPAMTIGKKAN